MSAKTKIIVLHMKEVIYTGIFLLLAVILAIVLFFMFGPGQKKSASADANPSGKFKRKHRSHVSSHGTGSGITGQPDLYLPVAGKYPIFRRSEIYLHDSFECN